MRPPGVREGLRVVSAGCQASQAMRSPAIGMLSARSDPYPLWPVSLEKAGYFLEQIGIAPMGMEMAAARRRWRT